MVTDGYASYEALGGPVGSSGALIHNSAAFQPFTAAPTNHQHSSSYAPAQYMSSAPIKPEYYGDDDMSPFGMAYASMETGHGTNSFDASYTEASSPAYVSTRPHHQPFLSQEQNYHHHHQRHQAPLRPPFMQVQTAPQLASFRSQRARDEDPAIYQLPYPLHQSYR